MFPEPGGPLYRRPPPPPGPHGFIPPGSLHPRALPPGPLPPPMDMAGGSQCASHSHLSFYSQGELYLKIWKLEERTSFCSSHSFGRMWVTALFFFYCAKKVMERGLRKYSNKSFHRYRRKQWNKLYEKMKFPFRSNCFIWDSVWLLRGETRENGIPELFGVLVILFSGYSVSGQIVLLRKCEQSVWFLNEPFPEIFGCLSLTLDGSFRENSFGPGEQEHGEVITSQYRGIIIQHYVL